MKIIYTSLFVLISFQLFGQKRIAGEYLIQTSDNIEQFVKETRSAYKSPKAMDIHTIAPVVNTAVLHIEDEQQLDFFRTNPEVVSITPSYMLERREVPNDANYALQWDMKTAGFQDLWDITTGGKNYFGDDIVVAVIDQGMEINHIDIANQIVVNNGEIPDDGIDNDNNGYIDDYKGYNASRRQGDVEDHHHGTSVMGIVGAKGNNGTGVTGTNWNVKVLPISNYNLSTPAIIHAYQYVYDMRKLYNDTNGEQGLFIVATNLSLGLSGKWEKYKAWCELYDKLKSVGVLNAGAGPNSPINIDNFPDMPANCPSEGLIGVTNTSQEDVLYKDAGFGKNDIDLGAPGQGSYTLKEGDDYGSFGGTSGATPHVAGAIALLQSLPCQELARLNKEEPSKSVAIIKDALLGGVDTLPSLIDKTATGGRLNVFRAAQRLSGICPELKFPSKKGALRIIEIKPLDGSLGVEYISPDEKDITMIIMDAKGNTIATKTFTPPTYGNRIEYIDLPDLHSGVYIVGLYRNAAKNFKKYVHVRK